MAGYTREIWSVSQKDGTTRYSGFARFNGNGNFVGTAGGYGARGVANSSRGKSKVQNTIFNSGARGDARNPASRRRTS